MNITKTTKAFWKVVSNLRSFLAQRRGKMMAIEIPKVPQKIEK
jgi:hypothetical protein